MWTSLIFHGPIRFSSPSRRGTVCLLYEATPGELARFVSLASRRYADTRKFREVERQEIQDFLSGPTR